jgi:syntaxin 1B/2/3
LKKKKGCLSYLTHTDPLFFFFVALEASNAGLPNNSDANIRRSQVAKLKKNFMDSIMRYQDVERTYQQKYRQRMERQIKIGKE